MKPDRQSIADSRSGAVLVMVIVLLLISIMIAGAIVHSLALDARQLDWNRHALQADRLAESGLRRARVQLAADPAFQGETWTPPLPGGKGEVVITITSDKQIRIIKSRATFPVDSAMPVRSTRTMRVPVP